MDAALRAEVRCRPEAGEVAQIGLGDQHDIAAVVRRHRRRGHPWGRTSRGGSSRSRRRRGRLRPGSSRGRRTPPSRCSRGLLGQHADVAAAVRCARTTPCRHRREDGVVAAEAGAVAGVEAGAALTHDDRAGRHRLARRTPSRRAAGRASRDRSSTSRGPSYAPSPVSSLGFVARGFRAGFGLSAAAEAAGAFRAAASWQRRGFFAAGFLAGAAAAFSAGFSSAAFLRRRPLGLRRRRSRRSGSGSTRTGARASS